MQIIKIDDEIGYWGVNAQDITRQLEEMTGDIEVHISSPGGSVFEGIAIFNALRSYNKGEITTVIVSIAASMASIIALAGSKVKAYDNAVFMIHNALMYVGGNASYLRKKADILESLSKMLAKTYVSKTGKKDSEIKKFMDDETYFFGDQMLTHGFVDEIIKSNNDKDSASAIILATESVQNCMNNYREKSKGEDLEKSVAILGVNPAKVEASAQITKSKQGDNIMDEAQLKALTDSHAEALNMAGASATQNERARVSAILALSGDESVKLKAISDGSSVGDTAIALNSAMATSMSSQKTDFEQAALELQGMKQADGNVEDLSDEAKKEKDALSALDQHFGKDK